MSTRTSIISIVGVCFGLAGKNIDIVLCAISVGAGTVKENRHDDVISASGGVSLISKQ